MKYVNNYNLLYLNLDNNIGDINVLKYQTLKINII